MTEAEKQAILERMAIADDFWNKAKEDIYRLIDELDISNREVDRLQSKLHELSDFAKYHSLKRGK